MAERFGEVDSKTSVGRVSVGQVSPSIGILEPMEGIPLGLEYLAGATHLLVTNQSIDMADDSIGKFASKTWHVLNTKGERLYVVSEKIDRGCCPGGQDRPFVIEILDHSGRIALKIRRLVTPTIFWWGGESCGSVVSAFDKDDNLLGFIRQKSNPIVTGYQVRDRNNSVVLSIKSDKWRCWPNRVLNQFDIFDKKSTKAEGNEKIPLGRIRKNYSGFAPFTSADTFGITFPADLDILEKATLVGALFLIYFQFYEGKRGRCTGCCLLICFILFVLFVVFGSFSILYITQDKK